MSKGRIENLNEDFWEYVTQEAALHIKKFQNVTQDQRHRRIVQKRIVTQWIILLKNYLSAQMECLYTKLVYSLFKTEHLPISECTYVSAN